MMYLGIDQHARQLTISLRDESGDVIETQQAREQSPPVREGSDEAVKFKMDLVEIKSYVGGLVPSFERRVA